MKLKFYFILALIAGLSFSSSALEKKLAYSKSVGVTIYVISETSDWCQDALQLKMVADTDDVFQGKAVTGLVKKLGALFKRECPKASSLTLEGVSKSGEWLYSGDAEKAQAWALSSVDDGSDLESNNQVSQLASSSMPAEDSSRDQSVGSTSSAAFLKSDHKVSTFPNDKEQSLIKGLTLNCQIKLFGLESSRFVEQDLFFKTGKGFRCDRGFLKGKGSLSIVEEDGNSLMRIKIQVIEGVLFSDYSLKNGVAVAVRQLKIDGEPKLITWNGKNDARGDYALAQHGFAKYSNSDVTFNVWNWERNLILTSIPNQSLRSKRKVSGIRKRLSSFAMTHYESQVKESYWSKSTKKTYLAISDVYDYPNYSSYVLEDGMEYSRQRKRWAKMEYTNHALKRYKQEQEEKRLAAEKRRRFKKQLEIAQNKYETMKRNAIIEMRKTLKEKDFASRAGYVFARVAAPPTIDDMSEYHSPSYWDFEVRSESLSSAWDEFLYKKQATDYPIGEGFYLLEVANNKIVWPENYDRDFHEDSVEKIVNGWVIASADIYAEEVDNQVLPSLKVKSFYPCKEAICNELKSDKFIINYLYNRKQEDKE